MTATATRPSTPAVHLSPRLTMATTAGCCASCGTTTAPSR